MDKCKCNAVTKVLGDGCKYCNPQYYIEILEAQQSDYEAETEQLRSELSALQEEVERLRGAFNPRNWSQLQSHAWHNAIPDVQKAFSDLLAATASLSGGDE